jgi:hypothetical protein
MRCVPTQQLLPGAAVVALDSSGPQGRRRAPQCPLSFDAEHVLPLFKGFKESDLRRPLVRQ